MKILLDTHVFIWMTSDADRLSRRAIKLIEDSANTKYLSLVSAWEIQIKSQLGKLTLNGHLQNIIDTQQQENGLQVLPITLDHIIGVGNLALYHRDPFDRLLLAQAQVENLIMISSDEKLSEHNVTLEW